MTLEKHPPSKPTRMKSLLVSQLVVVAALHPLSKIKVDQDIAVAFTERSTSVSRAFVSSFPRLVDGSNEDVVLVTLEESPLPYPSPK